MREREEQLCRQWITIDLSAISGRWLMLATWPGDGVPRGERVAKNQKHEGLRRHGKNGGRGFNSVSL